MTTRESFLNSRSLENPFFLVRFGGALDDATLFLSLFFFFSFFLYFNDRSGGSRLFSSKALLYAKTNVRSSERNSSHFRANFRAIVSVKVNCEAFHQNEIVFEAPRSDESSWITITRKHLVGKDKFKSLRSIVNTLTATSLVYLSFRSFHRDSVSSVSRWRFYLIKNNYL